MNKSIALTILVIAALMATACAPGFNQPGATGAKGDQGETGATGANGHDGATGSTGATGATGSAGNNGTNGTNGKDGKDGTTVSVVQFCPGQHGTGTYPEIGICIGGKIYANFWDGRNSWLAEVVPGAYMSTSTTAPCNFKVAANCVVTR